MPQFTAAEIAEHLEGEVVGDPQVVLTGFAPAETAQSGDLTFAENADFLARATAGAATAILTGLAAESTKTLIRVPNARLACARVLPLFFPEPAFPPGVHPTAVVDPAARVHPTAHLGPHCVVGSDVQVGAGTVVEAGTVVGAGCRIGEACHLFPNVTLYPRTQVGNRVRIHAGAVLGADGYAYVFEGGAHRKVPQVGHVILHDDVEVGANVTIDRGALGATVVGRGTKIDNLVHLAHNVVVGEHCLLIAQVGIAGSTRIGNYVTLAGQVGIADHLRIGDRVTVGAQSGVMHSIPDGEKWLGAPARPAPLMKRQYVAVTQLPALLKRVAELERRVAEQSPPPATTDH
jgi:UDP-3-O-[3-hydroxymyristoyl] glucosamine N-acyltransferase